MTSKDVELLEVLVAPRSRTIGQTLKQLHFRTKYGLNIVALWQGERAYRTAFSEFELQGGEALLVHGSSERFKVLQDDAYWIVLRLNGGDPARARKMLLALSIMAIVSAWPASFVLFIGAVAMIMTGCLSMDEAYQAIDWRSVFSSRGHVASRHRASEYGRGQVIGGHHYPVDRWSWTNIFVVVMIALPLFWHVIG